MRWSPAALAFVVAIVGVAVAINLKVRKEPDPGRAGHWQVDSGTQWDWGTGELDEVGENISTFEDESRKAW